MAGNYLKKNIELQMEQLIMMKTVQEIGMQQNSVKLQSAGGTADPGNADGRNIWTAIGWW